MRSKSMRELLEEQEEAFQDARAVAAAAYAAEVAAANKDEIVEVGNLFCISSNQVWRPGSYESREAARLAFELSDETLTALQESVNPDGVITLAMLEAITAETPKE